LGAKVSLLYAFLLKIFLFQAGSSCVLFFKGMTSGKIRMKPRALRGKERFKGPSWRVDQPDFLWGFSPQCSGFLLSREMALFFTGYFITGSFPSW
jgi:hypothetical protein